MSSAKLIPSCNATQPGHTIMNTQIFQIPPYCNLDICNETGSIFTGGGMLPYQSDFKNGELQGSVGLVQGLFSCLFKVCFGLGVSKACLELGLLFGVWESTKLVRGPGLRHHCSLGPVHCTASDLQEQTRAQTTTTLVLACPCCRPSCTVEIISVPDSSSLRCPSQ